MTLEKRITDFLMKAPNYMANEWEILSALYPAAKMGDKSNGARMGNIRRAARKSPHLIILGVNASDIALIK